MKTLVPADPLPALKALADGSRLRLLRLLDLEELTVGELAACTGLQQSSVSRHLAALRAAGLLEERSEGVRTYVKRAAPNAALRPLLDALLGLVRDEGFGHPGDLRALDAVRRERAATREEFFDSLAGDWDAVRAELLDGRLAPPEVASLLMPQGLRIVDAGAGTGLYLPWFSAIAGPDGHVIAVERSPAMLARAKARAVGLPNVEVRRGRIEDLPVPDGWADALVLSLSLGHVADPDAALARAVRAVRPGGRVAVADVVRHGDETLVRRLGPGFTGFEPTDLLACMERAGLTRVRRVELPAPVLDCRTPDGNGRKLGGGRFAPLAPLCAVGVVPEPKPRASATKRRPTSKETRP